MFRQTKSPQPELLHQIVLHEIPDKMEREGRTTKGQKRERQSESLPPTRTQGLERGESGTIEGALNGSLGSPGTPDIGISAQEQQSVDELSSPSSIPGRSSVDELPLPRKNLRQDKTQKYQAFICFIYQKKEENNRRPRNSKPLRTNRCSATAPTVKAVRSIWAELVTCFGVFLGPKVGRLILG